jgi:hypothetical protein
MKCESHKIRLAVRSIALRDVYQDVVRISEKSRGGLQTGRIHKVKVGRKAAHFILRGSHPNNDGKILMDEASREKLGLEPSAECVFHIREVGFWGEILWVWGAINPAYRIAGRLGVLSFILGVLAIGPLAWEILVWSFRALSILIWG